MTTKPKTKFYRIASGSSVLIVNAVYYVVFNAKNIDEPYTLKSNGIKMDAITGNHLVC